MKRDTWVVIPGFNEARYIRRVLQKLKKVTKNIIFIDDGSSDNTYELACSEIPQVLRHKINLGKGAALKTGCTYAFNNLAAKAVIVMDADDQHDAKEVKLFLKALSEGNSLVFGVRGIDENMPVIKRLANKSLSLLLFILFGKYIPDIPSGFKAFSKEIFEKITWDATGYEVEAEIAAWSAQEKLEFTTICISTIYHDMNKGMTFLDALNLVTPILSWRLKL